MSIEESKRNHPSSQSKDLTDDSLESRKESIKDDPKITLIRSKK
jgi:hypothetical protein